ncbi:helicase-related protein [Archangium lansingense]|uniref:Helicase-related protein n=1 Tax=Archangium lansingense TaxID=2995310 RepID=A0ABT3ZV29_9BACT|nr:helicase-related protein [Archangium lansinium]MCY1072919.1 helicase-related protein [Archangium lansinium]
MSFSWARAASALRKRVAEDAARPREEQHLDDGQRASLTWMTERLPQSGVVLADEVGTGKTRIACAVVHAVLEAGGRAAVVVPHGLMHQWQHEARMLGMPYAKTFTSVRDFIEDAKSKTWEEIAPAPGATEWLLVSHGFRAPQVRQGRRPAEWRVALPSYVRAELTAQATRDDRRTFAGRLLDDPHVTTGRIASELVRQVRGQDRVKLRERLDQLPPYRRDGDNRKLIEALKDDGRLLVEDLLGLWLGEFDLLVIDEAHKSRGEVDVEGTAMGAVSGTVLARLVDVLLKQPESGQRLCLTATPMELKLSQWLELLERARSEIDRERGNQVIERLHDAAGRAAVAPDEDSRLDELCAAARDFAETLAPYVTRRRRNEDPLVQGFREKLPAGRLRDAPHPHRNVLPLRIGWAETVGERSPWLDVLFAAECMSQSARGLTLKDTADWPRAVRDAYTKLSAGHVSIDLSETEEPLHIPEPGVVDDHTRGKIARTAYWYRRLRVGRKRVLEGLPPVNGAELDPDAEHPRILAAVKEIEGWTLNREKVLVFGVFLRPLRLLRDVLNVRHALRAADASRPIAHDVHTDSALLGIALRQLERLRAERALSGRLAMGNGAEMRRALTDCHNDYKRLRRQVRERAKKPVVAWCTDPTLLGGAPVDRELEGALEDHLVSFVLDDFLATTSESDEVTHERFDALAAEFVEERLRPLLGELDNEDVDEEQAVLRHEALRALLEDDNGRQSVHARLLEGDTRWQTRRYLQAAFNRPGASPWVLIAQSQVGREGLNLHESCRVVVQFHAEWNPAVLEQQIGRVDRKGSLWEQRAQTWLAEGAQGEPPFIEVRQLIFEGTYDAFQWDRVMRRQHFFDASLFGSLLPAGAWERVPEGRLRELLAAAPSFRPPRSK